MNKPNFPRKAQWDESQGAWRCRFPILFPAGGHPLCQSPIPHLCNPPCYVSQPSPPHIHHIPNVNWEAGSDPPCFVPKQYFFTLDPNPYIVIPAWQPSPCSWWLLSLLLCKSFSDPSNNAWQSAWHEYMPNMCLLKEYTQQTRINLFYKHFLRVSFKVLKIQRRIWNSLL